MTEATEDLTLEERRAQLEGEMSDLLAAGKDAKSPKFRAVRDALADLDRPIHEAEVKIEEPLADDPSADDVGVWYELGVQAYRGQKPPRESITFGGQAFSLYVTDENPVQTGDHLQFNQVRRGQRVLLWKEDLEAIEAAKGQKFVRVRNAATGQCGVFSKNVRGFRKTKGDIPLECFLYMRPCEEPKPADHEPQEVFTSLADQ